jgi:hypothetical protein
MERRDFIASMTLVLTAPLPVLAQQASRASIGWLATAPRPDALN